MILRNKETNPKEKLPAQVRNKQTNERKKKKKKERKERRKATRNKTEATNFPVMSGNTLYQAHCHTNPFRCLVLRVRHTQGFKQIR